MWSSSHKEVLQRKISDTAVYVQRRGVSEDKTATADACLLAGNTNTTEPFC